MASASISETINAPVETVFGVITNYESYPEFLSETKDARVIEGSGDTKLVEFEIDLVRKISYRLKMSETPNSKIRWKLDSGSIFKKNSGGWDLVDEGGKTRVKYFVDIEFKFLVPSLITKRLVGANLPSMIKSFKKRAEALNSQGGKS